MLCRFGFPAWLAGTLAVSAAFGAEAPLYTPGQMMDPSQVVTANYDGTAGPMDPNVAPASHCTACNFDAIGQWHEANYRKQHMPISKRLRGVQTTGAQGCDDGGDGYCDFKLANPWSSLDFEKRFFFAFIPRNAQGFATQAAYGDSYGGQFGVEWLPWVLTDGSSRYSRMGISTIFEYANFEGGGGTTLQSRQTLTYVTIGDGVSYSFIIGPTYRVDFDLFGIRMSPNATIGVDFEWTTLRERQPSSLNIRRVNAFKYSGFDAGLYGRLMWDYGIGDSMTFGIGMDYKYVPTDVMVRSNEARKHTAFILQLTFNF